METNQNTILGEEKISRLLIKFSVPCIAGLLISAFYNIVDQIFIGNSELGFLGNAATGVSFPIICIANAFAWCVGDGAASYLSICAGRKDTDSAHKCVGTGLTVSFIISMILMILCELFSQPLMRTFGASDQTITMAVEYFKIVVAFFPFYLLMNVMNSMIRADGSPTYSMIAMLTGAITNIILDPVFIFVFKWGIAGAAWATAIGQLLSFIICTFYFLKPKTFKLTKKSFVPDKIILRSVVKLGISTFVTQISIVVMSLVCNIMLFKYGQLSKYGPDIPISVFSIQTKVYAIVCNIVVGIVLGGQPIFGYNYGAKKYDRVREAYRLVIKYSIIVGIVATLIFQLCPQIIINLFGAGNELYMEFANDTFRIYMSFISITCIIKMSVIFFQSIGKSVQAALSSLIRDLICFTPLAIILPYIMESNEAGTGIRGLLYAAPISDVIALIVIIILTVPFFKNLGKEKPNISIEDTTPVIKKSKKGIIITISREHGTAGKQIGKIISEKLDIPFYYKEMVAIAANESGLSSEFISNLNINSPAVLKDLYLNTNAVQQALLAQEKTIKKIADNGSCVIVGRGADHILREYENVVNIFIYAPKDYRIKKVMEMYGDSFNEAVSNIHHSDEARSAYYNNISGKEWKDIHNYNLCVDASIGTEKAVDIICNYISYQTF